VLDALRDNGALEEFIVCTPCAEARGITEADLAPWATFGGADDLARQADAHDTTMTF
jgi:sulfur relay (sulfurtransferase) complex TusBCD TusD component (DsrE family)